MIQTPLTKYYTHAKSERGFLSAKDMGISHKFHRLGCDIFKVNVEGEPYYVKRVGRTIDQNKHKIDAEVLLSQVYSKLGIESAIYLPLQNRGRSYVISNDVSSSQNVVAGNFLYKVLSGTHRDKLPFLLPAQELPIHPDTIYTQRAMAEQTLLRIVDVASYNFDGHYHNILYKFGQQDGSAQQTQQAATQTQNAGTLTEQPQGLPTRTSNIEQAPSQLILPSTSIIIPQPSIETPNPVLSHYRGRVSGIIAIDHERCGDILSEIAQGNEYADFLNLYENDFDYHNLPREEMIEQVKNSEKLARLVNVNAVAEAIGSVNPNEVAEDIYSVTGYRVDQGITDALSASFDEVAEALIK